MDWLEVFIVPVSSLFIVMAMFMPFTDEYVWMKLICVHTDIDCKSFYIL